PSARINTDATKTSLVLIAADDCAGRASRATYVICTPERFRPGLDSWGYSRPGLARPSRCSILWIDIRSMPAARAAAEMLPSCCASRREMYRRSNSLITFCLASLNGIETSTGTVIDASADVAVCDGVTVIDCSGRGAG